MDLHEKYMTLSDLRARARTRLPHFVWEFLDSGTGDEHTRDKLRAAYDRISFLPAILRGDQTINLTTSFLDQSFALPFGIAPVGMSGLFWPHAERHLARAASALGLPYTLSTVASVTPEDIAGDIDQNAWFQLYTPRAPEIRSDILRRARAAGFRTLVFTADLPASSRRERQVRSGLTQPPRLTPRILAQIARRPAWAWGMARAGLPRMRLIDSYAPDTKGLSSTAHAGYLMRTNPDWDYLKATRDAWEGPLIVKGVLDPEDAPHLKAAGVDALWVSNHAGRQFDAAPPAIDMLPAIRAATDLPLILDSGIESGLDILRAYARGADYVMLGRAWHYALGALGASGPDHLAHILREDLCANMGQLGITTPPQAATRLNM